MRRILRRFHVQRSSEAVVTLALLVSYPLLLVIATLPTDSDDRLPWCWTFLVVVIVSYLAEAWAPRVTPYLVGTLNWLQMGILLRWVFREVALIILLDRALDLTTLQMAAFVLGLVGAPLVHALFRVVPPPQIDAGYPSLVIAGLLVGVGTRYGSGCTSGHGVCGLSRLSMRSLAATACFMAAGFASVFVLRHLLHS